MTNSSKDEQFPPLPETPDSPSGMDCRAFLMRHAAIGAAAVMIGTTWAPEASSFNLEGVAHQLFAEAEFDLSCERLESVVLCCH
jgi:hypothetical protein